MDAEGLPVVPIDIGECYELCLRGIREQNRHHMAHRRRDYKTSLERAYRESDAMVVGACVCKHADYHATYLPPPKPGAEVMRGVIQGLIEPTVAEVFIRPRNQANLEAV